MSAYAMSSQKMMTTLGGLEPDVPKRGERQPHKRTARITAAIPRQKMKQVTGPFCRVPPGRFNNSAKANAAKGGRFRAARRRAVQSGANTNGITLRHSSRQKNFPVTCVTRDLLLHFARTSAMG
jgi:hypothetical protein